MKILDCTLRDGGYYTHWDFNRDIVRLYLGTLAQMPVDYIELGYRSVSQECYEGEYCYLPVSTLRFCKLHCGNKKLVVMVNAKEINETNIVGLLEPCCGYVDMVRVAVRPSDIKEMHKIIRVIKGMGFEICLNVMYMSTWQQIGGFFEELIGIENLADYLCMVDSYGAVLPDDIPEIINKIRQYTPIPLCFHGHQNMELAFANTLKAIDCDCQIVDSTITGMGRGAGNLKTELLLTYLSSLGEDIPFHSLNTLIDEFERLKDKYRWGVNLPYMISGAYSLPQKDIMEWMSRRRYSVSSIVQTLQNRTLGNKKLQFEPLEKSSAKYSLIIGGGDSVVVHLDAIQSFILKNKTCISIVFSSTKHLSLFDFIPSEIQRYICLVGTEGRRLQKYDVHRRENDIYVINSVACQMDTYIPSFAIEHTKQLPLCASNSEYPDSPLFISLSIATGKEIFLAGFDGYVNIDEDAYDLMHENQTILDNYIGDVKSLLPTRYNNLRVESIYTMI
ncbi:MAG: aldolase catalytic domain-containing protein [Paludibacteraceae bacterium]|nr:aldolase catalytic domain-containing protein [Paludibacteraceae bacterium]